MPILTGVKNFLQGMFGGRYLIAKVPRRPELDAELAADDGWLDVVGIEPLEQAGFPVRQGQPGVMDHLGVGRINVRIRRSTDQAQLRLLHPVAEDRRRGALATWTSIGFHPLRPVVQATADRRVGDSAVLPAPD